MDATSVPGWMQRRAKRAPHLRAGVWGEKCAERFLKKKGFRVVGRRVRVGRRDELDLVARDGDRLVFVEVKTRRNEDFGRPADAVNRGKRKVLSRAAVRYMRKLNPPPRYFRFDIVEVIGSPEDKGEPAVRHIENAFPLEGSYRVG